MSVTIEKTDEQVRVTFDTFKTNSSLPLIFQICQYCCCNPFCDVSESFRKEISGSFAVIGVIQIFTGMVNISFGLIVSSYTWVEPFLIWTGIAFILIGGFCLLASKFCNPCTAFLSVFLNVISTVCAITAIVYAAINVSYRQWSQCFVDLKNEYCPCYNDKEWIIYEDIQKACVDIMKKNKIDIFALEILILVFDVLQACVAIAAVIIGCKTLSKCRNHKMAIVNTEECEMITPLLEDTD
ncbi:membrane-spanning 4-domains subfamily A member 4A-like isoform X1 [Erpetoichthys calabaricus]|uniref:membrane-spanning 4-domains subfamily A member 4A-like isoform X1 n=1 Tax=Erpetoichthys calabaricus TaxID=27687 RepID=UPI0022341D0D|nr:membrane-spanning 4-domains subfamily A member 4A-like isoform X1 [Erpetoichthys calabaricus]XP_028649972.2 membrane-spanning 4-domains subfamily A member 4A-like isoform X1 [Erpetoichthys calabaricus]